MRKTIFNALLVLISVNAYAGGTISALGCNLYLPDGYEGYYRTDGSISFMYEGSSINLSKFDGYLKSGSVGDYELSVSEIDKYGLRIIEGRKVNKQSGSVMEIVQISNGTIRVLIMGPMAKDWNEIFKDCDSD